MTRIHCDICDATPALEDRGLWAGNSLPKCHALRNLSLNINASNSTGKKSALCDRCFARLFAAAADHVAAQKETNQ